MTSLLEAGQDIKKRRFTATGRTEQADKLSLRHIEIDAFKRAVAARAVPECFPNIVRMQHVNILRSE